VDLRTFVLDLSFHIWYNKTMKERTILDETMIQHRELPLARPGISGRWEQFKDWLRKVSDVMGW
jgi:hypothetical protein